MKAFCIDTIIGPVIVVADSLIEASELYEKTTGYEVANIKVLTDQVIVRECIASAGTQISSDLKKDTIVGKKDGK